MPKRKLRFSWDWISHIFKVIELGGIAVGAVLVLIVLISIALLKFFVLNWFAGQVSLPISVSTSSLPVSSPIDQIPLADAFNGSFTELFSGTGWSDGSLTTAYLDQTATSISLVPKFTVMPIMDAGGVSGQIPNVPTSITGTVVKTDAGYVINVLGNTVTSIYPGELHFGYDRSTGNTLVVYAAYMSHVFQIDARGAVTDYSERFGQRAFGGTTNGELAVDPVIFSEDGVWWISSGEGSTKPFLSKISGSSVTDLASIAFPSEGMLRALPGTAPHAIFVKGDSNSYLLYDEGFVPKSVQWASVRLNDWNGNVTKAVISRADDSGSSPFLAKGESEGVVHYFLSNDGGVTWIPAVPGAPVKFSSSGGDFRFKVELSPAAGNIYATPWVGVVGLQYSIVRK